MRRTHGMSNTPLYRVWARMKGCTTSVTHQDYKFYGAKGVKMCDEWFKSFLPFYEWSISNGYKQGLTLDRIDSCGDYSPNNCRWITIQEQQRNRRDNHLITIKGVTKCLSEWCREYNINYATVLSRFKRGMRWEDAFSEPLHLIRKDNKSGYSGVFKRKNGKWEASYSHNGRKIYVGEYQNIEDAISARENALQKSYKKRCTTYKKNNCCFVEETEK